MTVHRTGKHMDHRIGVAVVQAALQIAVRDRYGDAACREVLLGRIQPSLTAIFGVLQLNVIILNVRRRYGSILLVDLRPQREFQRVNICIRAFQFTRKGQGILNSLELHGG